MSTVPNPTLDQLNSLVQTLNTKSMLTEADYNNLVAALNVLNALQPHIDQATRAGVDVGASVQAIQDARQKILALKNNYFPGR